MHTLSRLKWLSWIVVLVAAAALPSAAQQTQQTDDLQKQAGPAQTTVRHDYSRP
jgi:hypothetical protein